MDLFNYSRRQATEVNIGATPMGGAHPIRIQCDGVGHTLDADRMSATHRSGANIYFSRLTAGVVE